MTIPRAGGCRKRTGVHLHRSATLTTAHTTCRSNIPVTTPARTIADLGRVASPALVRRAVRQAELQGFRLTPETDSVRTRSDLEDDFLRLCRRHRLPPPEVNVKIGRFEVDFLWRERSLIVELDSFRYHGTRTGFDADRARDVRLKLLGYDVVRFTDRRLAEDPAAVAEALRALMSMRRRGVSGGA